MSTIQATALQAKEEMQSQTDILQRVSTNWENRKVTIIVSGAFTLLATAGLVAATVLTAGSTAVIIASIAMGLGALTTTGLLYSPASQPTAIESSRVEPIIPQITTEEPESEKPVVDHKEPHANLIDSKGRVLHREEPLVMVPPSDVEEPQLFPMDPVPAQPPIEHPVAHVGNAPVLFDIPDEHAVEEEPKPFIIDEEEPSSSYSWKEIAGIGAAGIGIAALLYAYSEGYFSSGTPVMPEESSPPPTTNPETDPSSQTNGTTTETTFHSPSIKTTIQQPELNDTTSKTEPTVHGTPVVDERTTVQTPTSLPPVIARPPKTPVAPKINGTLSEPAPGSSREPVPPLTVVQRPYTLVETPQTSNTSNITSVAETVNKAAGQVPVPPTVVIRPDTPVEQPQQNTTAQTSHPKTTFSIKEKPFFETRECLPEAEEAFVQRYEQAKQCPTADAYIDHQAENGYFGWGIDKMRRLFGTERDLSLNESRHGFYHGVVQQNIPKMVKAHPKYESAPTEEVARDISTLRDTARDYTRERSWKVLHTYLNWAESKGP